MKIGGMEVEEISAGNRTEFIQKLAKVIRATVEDFKKGPDGSDGVFEEMSPEGKIEYIRAQQRSALKDQGMRVGKIKEAFDALMWLVTSSDGWYMKAAALGAQEMERGEAMKASAGGKGERILGELSEALGTDDAWGQIKEASDLVRRMAAVINDVTPHVIEAAKKHGFPDSLEGVIAESAKERAKKLAPKAKRDGQAD